MSAVEPSDTRLTVIETRRCSGQFGAWLELEIWHWPQEYPRPRRFELSLDGWPPLQIGDLVRRHPQDERCLSWWDNHGHRKAGRLLLVSDVEELPGLSI